MTLEIRLFGGLLLESGGRVLPRIPSRVGRSLFAYLVLNRDRELSRDLVAGTFWPEMSDSQARRRLSQSLWQIQTHLAESQIPGQWLVTSSDSVRFNPDAAYWLDTEVFDRLIVDLKAAGVEDLQSAIDLYRGDLMAGDYEDWLLVPQQNWRDHFIDALTHLIRRLKSTGRFEDALVYARRLTLHEPLRERGHREVMRLCYLCGRPNEALLQYEICYSTLQDELGTEPEPETTALFESIAADRQSAPLLLKPESPLIGGDQPIPLVGRSQERSIATGLMESVLKGQGGALLLEGPPGIGKSRLVDTMIEDASWRGLAIIRGPGVGDPRSFGPLVAGLERTLTTLRLQQLRESVEGVWLKRVSQLIPSLASSLADLPPPASLRPAEEAEGMREAIAQVLAALAHVSPLVLVIDDFDMIDEDSAAALQHLGKALEQHPILLVVVFEADSARRRPAIWEAIRSLDGLAIAHRVQLEPLNEDQTAELVRLSTAAELTTSATTSLHSDTGGNPLFILETIRAHHDQRIAAINQDQIHNPPIPESISAAVEQRLEALSPGERTTLEALAVIGSDAHINLIAKVTGRQIPDLDEDLAQLTARGLLSRSESGYSLRHRHMLQLVYEKAPQNASLHAAMAEAILDRVGPDRAALDGADLNGADLDGFGLDGVGQVDRALVAAHFEAAGDPEQAATNFEAAAEASVGLAAYATAATHYRSSIANTHGADPSVRFRRLAGLETVLDVLGERQEQETTIDQMEELALAEQRSECLRRRAWLQAHQDEFADASRSAAAAVALDESSPEMLAEDYRILGMLGLWSGSVTEAIRNLQQAVTLTDGPHRAVVTEALGRALGAAQRYEEATIQTERALGLFVVADDRRGQAEALGSLGIINMERGRTTESLTFYQRAIDVCSEIGYRHGVGVNTVNLANALWSLGKTGEAISHFENSIDTFTALGNRRGVALAKANSASLYLAIDDTDTARGYCNSALEYFKEVANTNGVAQVLCTLGDIAAAEGEFESGRAQLHQALEAVQESSNHWLEIQALDSLAALELAAGEFARSVEIATAGLGVSKNFGLNDFAANLLSLRAMAELRRGNIALALPDSEAAVKLLSDGNHRDYLVLYRHARILTEFEPAGDLAASQKGQAESYLEQARTAVTASLEGLQSEQLAIARAAHAAILGSGPQTATVLLASVSAPTGRPLRTDELVEVQWAISDESDDKIADAASTRRVQLVRLLDQAAAQGAAATVNDLASALEVSVRTVRRDISILRREGISVATRGSRHT